MAKRSGLFAYIDRLLRESEPPPADDLRALIEPAAARARPTPVLPPEAGRVPLLAIHALTADERAAADDEPRAGTWFGDRSFGDDGDADGQRLSRDDTDALIRGELFHAAAPAERAELSQALGEPRQVTLRVDKRRVLAGHQRGGVDSDPLVRLLAYRAWGDRDRRWFVDRGVRAGEVVSLSHGHRDGSDMVARAWSDLTCGVAAHDALPGELLEIVSPGIVSGRHRVSDRLREPPVGYAIEDVRGRLEAIEDLRTMYGFDALELERDLADRGALRVIASCHSVTFARVEPPMSPAPPSPEVQRCWDALNALARMFYRPLPARGWLLDHVIERALP